MCIRDRDYIENPAKTDEKMLVFSFACSYETADIESELLLSQADVYKRQIWMFINSSTTTIALPIRKAEYTPATTSGMAKNTTVCTKSV